MSQELPEARKIDLQRRARKSMLIAGLLGFFLSPLGYWYIGRTTLAIITFVTLNYVFTGFIVVPIHVLFSIQRARSELSAAGET